MTTSVDRTLTVHLPPDLAAQLDELAKAAGRKRSALAVAVLRNYVEAEGRLMREIEAGLAEADSGEFASEAEVAAVFAKYDR